MEDTLHYSKFPTLYFKGQGDLVSRLIIWITTVLYGL